MFPFYLFIYLPGQQHNVGPDPALCWCMLLKMNYYYLYTVYVATQFFEN